MPPKKQPQTLTDAVDDVGYIQYATQHVICKLSLSPQQLVEGSQVRDVQLDRVDTQAYGASLRTGGWEKTSVRVTANAREVPHHC